MSSATGVERRIDAMSGLLRGSVHETLVEMADLYHVCAPRPVDPTEVFTGNAFYGFGRILKAYAGLPAEHPLYAVVPHGVYMNDHLVSHGELRAHLPAVLSYPEYRDRVYHDRSRMAVVPCASPFAFALDVVPEESVEREGSVFFPAHSLEGSVAQQDSAAQIELCRSLPERFGPVSVCIHFQDYLEGRHRPFLDAGMTVYSAGHRHDPRFVVRLVRLLRAHRYCLSNANGSHVFYSIAAGCDFLMIGDRPRHVGERVDIDHPVASPERRITIDAYVERLRQEGYSRSPEGLALADYYLRTDQLHSPNQLRRILHDCERVDSKSFLSPSATITARTPVPFRWTRGVHRGWILGVSIWRRLRRRVLRAVNGVRPGATR